MGDTDCTTLLRVSSKWDMRSKEPGNGLVPRTSARRLKDGSLSSGTLIKYVNTFHWEYYLMAPTPLIWLVLPVDHRPFELAARN